MASAAFRDGESIRDVEAAVAVGVGGSHGGPAKYGPTCQLSHWFFFDTVEAAVAVGVGGRGRNEGNRQKINPGREVSIRRRRAARTRLDCGQHTLQTGPSSAFCCRRRRTQRRGPRTPTTVCKMSTVRA
jgi:hypothetical protein